MGKRPEDEIQEKLVKLELSIKEEEAKALHPAPSNASSTQLTEHTLSHDSDETDSSGPEFDLTTLGGFGLIAVGVYQLMSHIMLSTPFWALWGSGRVNGFLVLPLLIGIGMLFYNYKSKVGLLVTFGGLALILFTILNQITFTFVAVTLIQFLFMAAFVCAGVAMLARARVRRLAGKAGGRLIK